MCHHTIYSIRKPAGSAALSPKNGYRVPNDLFDFDELNEMINRDSQVESAYAISFDVFDTLLKRRLLNQENSWKNFSTYFFFMRFISEKIARHLHTRLKSREVTLEQIYHLMPRRYKIADELKREKANLEIDTEIERTILKLQGQGKRLILISDTYYRAEHLRYFLEEAKFDLDSIEIVTSSEYGINKPKGLFLEVQKSLSLEFQKWIHIGDDLRADYFAPKSLGILSFLYVNHINQFLHSNLLSPKGLRRLERIKGPVFIYELSELFEEIQKELGIDYLDFVSTIIVKPIVMHSVSIIDNSEKRRGSGLMLYCSRDGWMFYNAHLILQQGDPSNLEIEYFKTSRALRNRPESRSYVDGVTKKYQTIGVFDLGWKGSTLAFLNRSYPSVAWKGYFFTSTYSGRADFANIANFSPREKLNILRSREFLELMFPAPTPSYADIDSAGVPVTAEFDGMRDQIDAQRICNNVLNRKIALKELKFEDAVTMIKLLAIYPGSSWIAEMSALNFDSSGERSIPLVTDNWSKLWSRSKILWPLSAQPVHSAGLRIFFKPACIIKELMQKIPISKRLFIG